MTVLNSKPSFETETFGKWILCGEHTVLRGGPALAFPLRSKSLKLEYSASAESLQVEFSGSHGEELKLLFYGVLDNALNRLKIPTGVTGRFRLTSTLPVGTGLGASAALCGAVARWCVWQNWVKNDELYDFARGLEDLFHGESSGVDLAVSLSAEGVRFVRGGPRTKIHVTWWPQLYLSYCGGRGMTAECVQKVKNWIEQNPQEGARVDQQMIESVRFAEEALKTEDRALLVRSIKMARDCFDRWGLTGGPLAQHLSLMSESGALAVKPTGSGGGGYALSLWEVEPPTHLQPLLTKIPAPFLSQ